jgi:hypothetical protein
VGPSAAHPQIAQARGNRGTYHTAGAPAPPQPARGVAPRLGMAVLGTSGTPHGRARMPRSLRVRPLGHRIGAIGYRSPRASPAVLSVAQLGAHRRELVAESELAVCATLAPVAEALGQVGPKMPAGRGCDITVVALRWGGVGMRRGMYGVYWKRQHAHVLRQECAHAPKWVVHDHNVSLAICVLFCTLFLSPLCLLL